MEYAGLSFWPIGVTFGGAFPPWSWYWYWPHSPEHHLAETINRGPVCKTHAKHFVHMLKSHSLLKVGQLWLVRFMAHTYPACMHLACYVERRMGSARFSLPRRYCLKKFSVVPHLLSRGWSLAYVIIVLGNDLPLMWFFCLFLKVLIYLKKEDKLERELINIGWLCGHPPEGALLFLTKAILALCFVRFVLLLSSSP